METEYSEKKKKLEELNKKRIQQLKMKSLLIKKHDVDEEFDEEAELATEEDIIIVKKERTIIDTLFSFPGIVILSSLVVFFIINNFIDTLEVKKSKKAK